LAAIKGVGESAVRNIVAEREKNGRYTDIYDFVNRVDLRQSNKRVLEGLAYAGAFDDFAEVHRAQFFASANGGATFIEQLIKFGSAMQSASDAPPDLFGGTVAVEVNTPEAPFAERWGNLEQLTKEREVVGIYISAHPLDDFKLEIKNFGKGELKLLHHMDQIENQELALAGMVAGVEHRTTKTGKPFGSFEFEDFNDSHKFFIFAEDYLKLKHFLLPGAFLFIKGRVTQRQWSKTKELEFKISAIELLNDLRQKKTKKVTLELRLGDVNDALLAKLNTVLGSQKNGNSCPVEFRVLDPMRKLSIRMPSRSMKIDLSNETIKQLDAMSELKYVLNG
jgi:DNA polymerase-3 subunit alpha